MALPRAIIIGAGIGGIATASILAKAGYQVDVYEQAATAGGRAGTFQAQGFTFDTGPSWYLMPEIFEHYFSLFGHKAADMLDLIKLTPAYTVFFEGHVEPVTITGDIRHDTRTFEVIEPGAGDALQRYVAGSRRTYELARDSFLYTNFDSLAPFLNRQVLAAGPQMLHSTAQTIDAFVSKRFTDLRLRQILEYQMVFLGTSPFRAPALYHLMSHLDFSQGVFYPQGGMYKVIEAMQSIAQEAGVRFHFNAPVNVITTSSRRATGVTLGDGTQQTADVVVSNADLHFTETKLIPESKRTYPEAYWQKREAGPSGLLIYLGVRGALPQLAHHSLIFTSQWEENFSKIYDTKEWPHPASIYISRTSATDPTVAPKGHENIFVLVPMQADATITQEECDAQADIYLRQIADMAGIPDLLQRIVYKKVVGPRYFADSFNAWHGTALGLSHTLMQSAMFRPRNKSKHLDNMYYTGGNTVPGIGMPMCLIGAELVYKRLAKDRSARPITSIVPLQGSE